jgi:DNA uptake protein ComE-like DNA-binding protein
VWTTSQRAVIATIACGLLIYVSVRFFCNPVHLPDPLPSHGDRATELADRLDPNTATAAQIAAIPNIGEKLAATIVEYRLRAEHDHPGKTVFTSIYSLTVIRGIGPAKLETLRAYLIFPPKPATTSSIR